METGRCKNPTQVLFLSCASLREFVFDNISKGFLDNTTEYAASLMSGQPFFQKQIMEGKPSYIHSNDTI